MSVRQAEFHPTATAARNWPLSNVMPPMAALPTVPGVARAFIRSTLPAWDMQALIENAELIASELAGNAVTASTDINGHPLYAAGRTALIQVRLLTDGVRALLEVWDQAPGIPEIRNADGHEESGRGLVLVEAIADKWGWHQNSRWPGKVVWAEMSSP